MMPYRKSLQRGLARRDLRRCQAPDPRVVPFDARSALEVDSRRGHGEGFGKGAWTSVSSEPAIHERSPIFHVVIATSGGGHVNVDVESGV
jgi:hypothetical protein